MGKFGGVPIEEQAQPQTSRFGGVTETTPVAQPARIYTEADISPMARQSRAEAGDIGEGLNTLREQMQDALLLGGSDELGAAAASLPSLPGAAMNWFRGGDFNTGYTERMQKAEGYKAAREARAPVTAAVGNVLGSLAGAGTLAKAGITTAGRTVPYVPQFLQPAAQVGTAALEGATVGATQGALSAPPGQRIAGGKQGAVTGGLASGLFQAAGTTASAIDDIFTKRGVTSPKLTAQDLATSGSKLYQRAEAEGVRYQPQAIDRLRVNVRAAAERINKDLRPITAGFVDDVMAIQNRSVSFEEFAELRKRLNKAIGNPRTADDDRRTLVQMKNAVDSFANKVNPAKDVTGGDPLKAMAYQKGADQLWQRHKKAETIEKIIDNAERKGEGTYTQSGIANATRREMESLYTRIQKGERGWTKQEIELIRQMAKGGSNSKMVNWLAKFAPRGVVSIMGGQMAGGLLTPFVGPWLGQTIPPMIGTVMGRKADQAAMDALEALRSGVASGKPSPIPPPISPATIIPATPVAMEAERRRRGGLGGPR